MNQRDRLTGLLGISKKAGKLMAGADVVVDSIRSGKKIYLVLLSSSASQNTVKKVSNCCTYYGVPLEKSALDGDILGKSVGKSSTVSSVGITDEGLANAVRALLYTVNEQTEHREDNE